MNIDDLNFCFPVVQDYSLLRIFNKVSYNHTEFVVTNLLVKSDFENFHEISRIICIGE